MSTILYQFALSHYVEKVRWALEFKKIPYTKKNLIPGPHIITIKRLAKNSTVPLLVHKGKNIQDSTQIIDYLETFQPNPTLNPDGAVAKKEALEWEEYFDQEVGIHLRRFFYCYVLGDRQLATSLLLQGTPAYSRLLYAFSFPLVRSFMRKGMNINLASGARSEKHLRAALEKLNNAVKKRDYLVGKRFSRADLTAASLLAPLVTPKQHPFSWPPTTRMPQDLQDFRAEFEKAPFFTWVQKMYATHRI